MCGRVLLYFPYMCSTCTSTLILLLAFWRALQIINIREENEKLNIWVAYFNLENEYGNPPEVQAWWQPFYFFLLSFSLLCIWSYCCYFCSLQEAVRKVFQRALQYNDPKKVHLALLGMYERTEQHKLTDELLDKMVKKYKHSCKVLLVLPTIIFFPLSKYLNFLFYEISGLVKTGAKDLEANKGCDPTCCESCFIKPSPA